MKDHAKCSQITSTPYSGQVTGKDGKRCSVVEAANYFDFPPLLYRVGDWVITRHGINCLYPAPYPIPKKRFGEDWISQVRDKTWANIQDFTQILDIAKRMVELKML